MQTFEINGKEYELKLTYQSISLLNSYTENNNPMEIVGQAMQGDLEFFPKIIHAALLHTGENFPLKTIEHAIEDKISNEEIDFLDIMEIGYEVVANSFFYARIVDKSLAENPQAKEQLEKLLNSEN